MGTSGSAGGKLILFGEHAAVHGWPALGVSLPERLEVTLDGAPSAGWDLAAVPADDRPGLAAALARMEAALPGLAGHRCAVRVSSAVPRAAGFGSSAALCGALARAALALLGTRADDGEAWRLAHDAEHVFHGTPSGIDTGLSLHPGISAFQPHPPGLPAREALPPAPLWLVAGAVHRTVSARALVADVSRRLGAGDPSAAADVHMLGELARAARDLLLAGGRVTGLPAALGALAGEAMAGLGRLGLGSPSLDRVLAAGASAGARGGKLSGAGGGGAFWLVAGGAAEADRVTAAVAAEARRAGIAFLAPPRALLLGS